MHPYLVSERHIHRHFVNVALTLQNADASQQMSLGYAVIPLLGTCKSTRTLEVDVMLAGTRVATVSELQHVLSIYLRENQSPLTHDVLFNC